MPGPGGKTANLDSIRPTQGLKLELQPLLGGAVPTTGQIWPRN